MTREKGFQKISELVERFTEQFSSYKKSDYNETLTRRDFIDPFFKALGWDVDNSNGNAEAYREVIHEDKVKVGGATKAPDYSFRLSGGKRLFFVEAKKPSVLIKDEVLPAYQIRRYGWSAKLAISIITDFEEFAIYDCTKKPNPKDKASVARIKYLTYKDYIKEFDFLWETFSKEKVLKGSFDKFIQSDKTKKGTATVDKAFLLSLDTWRTLIAIDLCKHNKKLNEDEINFAVQQTIDRLIFLRISEDRGVEPYGRLKDSIKTGNYYNNLFDLFREADEKYNSGLFDFKKDNISKGLILDNKIINTIINDLYYPESPYEFSVLSVEILGSAYEQFLGKQITVDKNHKAKIEEKPEVRKSGGVYYTPQYIVDYIVKNTVGKSIEGKTPKDVSKLKILDPACGSGSFLIGAYQFLLDWHKLYYNTNITPGKRSNFLTPEGNLSTGEKKRILLNNIFGVDIDTNAVEVTKLSLLLKCMEGETSASIAHQLSFFNERILPTLDNNIKNGNSLIDTDYYDSQIDFGEEKKTKPFNWVRMFPKIMETGFDIIIGNPPYFSLDIVSSEHKDYYESKFSTFATRQSNIYFFFIAKAKIILKPNGLLSFINERYYFNSKNALKFRKFIQDNFQVEQIVDFQNIQIFDGVNTLTVINTFKNSNKAVETNIIQFDPEVRKLDEFKIDDPSHSTNYYIKQKNINYLDWTFNKSELIDFKNRLEIHEPLSKIVYMGQGLKSGLNEVFIVDEATILKWNLEKELLVKYIKTKDIQPFQIKFRQLYLILALNETIIDKFPNIKKYLIQHKEALELRYQYKDGSCQWYSLSIPQNLSLMVKNSGKIFTPLYSKGNKFALDLKGTEGDFYILTDAFILINKTDVDLKYLVGLLNSKVLTFFNSKFGKLKRDAYYEYSRNTLSRLPIKIAKTKSEIVLKEKIIKNVEQIINLKQQLLAARLSSKIEELNSRIHHCTDNIDDAVFEIYDLPLNDRQLVKDHFTVN